MIIQCAIIDDSQNDIQIIKNTVVAICYGTNVLMNITTFQNPEDPEILKHYNLYILDIDMPGLNGFELAKKIYSCYPDASIIFCTMHENLVFESFRMNAFYFVRKQHLEDDLIYSLKKYTSVFHAPGIYVAKNEQGLTKISVDTILYFEVFHNDLYIHLSENTVVHERKSLKKVMAEMELYSFALIGKSYFVSLSHVASIKDYSLTLSDGETIAIPRSQFRTFKQKFLQFAAR